MEQMMTAEQPGPGVSPETLKKIVNKVLTSDAVDYSPVTGVWCPVCGAHLDAGKMGVRRTTAWLRGSRQRYHTCPVCGMKFKSVEGIETR
jgi:uncharacterized protein (UPF0212 family)